MASFGKVCLVLVCAFALLSAGAVSAKAKKNAPAIPITSCGIISASGNYELANDLSSAGGACINITAPSVQLDCLGFSINGAGTAQSYGVYSNQPGTVVKNCNVNNFWSGIHYENVAGGTVFKNSIRSDVTQAVGIYLRGGSGNLLQSNDAITRPSYGGAPIFLEGSSGNTLEGNYGESWKWIGIVLWDLAGQGSNSNTLTGNTGIAESDGIILWRSSYNTLNGNTGTGTGNPAGRGIYLVGAHDNRLSGNTCRATASSPSIGVVGCDLIWSSNNVLENNIVESQGGAAMSLYGDAANGASSGNLVVGNTLSSPNTGLRVFGAASGNTFYRNTFSASSFLYVLDEASGNSWDSGSVFAPKTGNYWPNVLSGAVQVIDQVPGDGWGDCGTGFPYSAATSQGKFVGPGADSAPATNLAGNCGLGGKGRAKAK